MKNAKNFWTGSKINSQKWPKCDIESDVTWEAKDEYLTISGEFFLFYDKIQNLSFSALKKLVTEVSLKKNCLKQKSGQFWDADLTKDFFWTEMQALFPESC